jgi:GT2 family glycosyltransferase
MGHLLFDMNVSHRNMLAFSHNNGIFCEEHYGKTSSICNNRNAGADRALEVDATWLLQIDTDMVFPPDALAQLISRQCKIVGGLYFGKQHPFYNAICGMKNPEGEGYKSLDWDHPSEMTGIKKVDGIGTGFLLVHTSVFRKMRQPYFMFKEIPGQANPGGEDYYFCEKAMAAGFEVYVDLDLKLGHITEYQITWTDHFMRKAIRMKQERDRVGQASQLIVPSGPTGSGRIIM